MRKQALLLGLCMLAAGLLAARGGEPPLRLFVLGQSEPHKRALMEIAGGAVRMEFEAPGNAFSFSGDFTLGQIEAMERLGARFEPVHEIRPLRSPQRFGHLRPARATPQSKPSCGDGVCKGREDATTCPADCGGGGGDGGGDGGDGGSGSRSCVPQDREEYQTLLLDGEVAPEAGAGLRLVVIDTGTTPSHPDLTVGICRDVTGRKVRNGCGDSDGHGTHASGSAAAHAGGDGLGLVGTAPGATLGMIKICNSLCYSDALVRAIEEAVRQDADIISLSFAAPHSQSLHNAVQYAVASGALFFAAAGNSGPAPDSIVHPAAYAETVAVGMLGPDRIVSPMSSRGVDDGDDGAVGPREVELVGGGFLVESTWNDGCYRVLSGTSMATPSVAGFAAAHWQGSAASTRAWLAGVAEDVDNAGVASEVDPSAAGFDSASGYGLPRSPAGTNGGSAASVRASPDDTLYGEDLILEVRGPRDAAYRIGVTSPSGEWAWGEFTTDAAGSDSVLLDPWRGRGSWLVTVDFGGGPSGFDAAFDTFLQR